MALHPSPLPMVLSPVVTPFDAKGNPDADKLAKQCKWLGKNGVGMALFGTNSEANSMSVAERINALAHVVKSGLSPNHMMPGAGACSVPDAVALSKAAVDLGCAGTLTLPPFYYKDVPDDGLFAYFAQIIEKVGDSRLQIYLYNIPPVSKVGFSLPLIERLIKAYPKTVVGMKDSSGDWAYTESVIKAFAPHGFRMYAGSESFLLRTLRAGGAGCISATTNVNPGPIAALAANWQAADADGKQAALDVVRGIFQSRPMIPAMKAAIAHFSGDAQWAEVRPPLVKLDAAKAADLIAAMKAANFEITGL
jgi:4-hydroxy-tetrahydrodipicolinate synthase